MSKTEFETMMRSLARVRTLFHDAAAKNNEIAEKIGEIQGIIMSNIDPLKFSQEPDFFAISKIKNRKAA